MKRFVMVSSLLSAALFAFGSGVSSTEEAPGESMSATADWFMGTGEPVHYNSPAEFQARTGRTISYVETPSLAAMVANGALPPIEDRLPSDPIVIAPAQEVGTHGGALVIPGDPGWINDEYMRSWFTTISLSGDEILGNIISTVEPNDDASQWTLTLRDGLRFSDGTPLTTADIEFWYNHEAKDPVLNPDGVGKLKIDGVMAELTLLDDITFQFDFAGPYPVFNTKLMRWFPDSLYPKHYMMQFHPAFVGDEEAQAIATDAGYTDWKSHWKDFLMWSNFNTDLPVFHPWNMVSKTNNLAIFERNPYYFKVDVAGNQLPYVDTIRVPLIGGSKEAVMLRALAGEIDVAKWGDLGGVANYSVMKNGESDGGYRLVPAMSALEYPGTIYFNFAHQDSTRRELYENIDFRRAVALALDGEELNNVLYRGQFTLTQSPASGDMYHASSEPYKEHDLDEANRLLTSLNLQWDGDFRTFPDGKPLDLYVIVENEKETEVQAAEVYKTQLAKVGINFLIRPYGGDVMSEKQSSADYDILVMPLDVPRGIPTNSIANMPHIVPSNPQGSHVSNAWVTWLHSGGAEGIEPPEDMKRLYDLQDAWPKTAALEDRIAMEHEIVDVFSANLWSISPVENPVDVPQVGFYYMNNRIGNVPSVALNSEYSYIYLESYHLVEQ